MEINSLELSRGFSNSGEADEGRMEGSYRERQCGSSVLRMGTLGRGQSRLREVGPRLPDQGQIPTLPPVDGLARTEMLM